MDLQTATALTPDEQDLFNRHGPIIRMAAARRGFRSLPEGGAEAVQAGLVTRNDPNWQMSDDHRACDSFRLTGLGTRLALAQGWQCQCAGCNQWRRRKGWSPAVTLDRYCPNCEAGIRQYGTTGLDGRESCRLDARRAREAEQEQAAMLSEAAPAGEGGAVFCRPAPPGEAT